MKQLLIILLISNFFIYSNADIIWNKELRIFTSLFNIPTFNAIKQKMLIRSRLLETHNFSGENVKIVYYQVQL